ncbi:hypothetical protein BaRGS_00034091 [Batillaria attramentaria]|uniref:Uncharacterized protein n=1 Tax=Batillaria attramentaria TaxID=370345 RepID=A0ABD0JI36_9CAEN
MRPVQPFILHGLHDRRISTSTLELRHLAYPGPSVRKYTYIPYAKKFGIRQTLAISSSVSTSRVRPVQPLNLAGSRDRISTSTLELSHLTYLKSIGRTYKMLSSLTVQKEDSS